MEIFVYVFIHNISAHSKLLTEAAALQNPEKKEAFLF
jgi:hypothetical protein